jgi:hypothetical protein
MIKWMEGWDKRSSNHIYVYTDIWRFGRFWKILQTICNCQKMSFQKIHFYEFSILLSNLRKFIKFQLLYIVHSHNPVGFIFVRSFANFQFLPEFHEFPQNQRVFIIFIFISSIYEPIHFCRFFEFSEFVLHR